MRVHLKCYATLASREKCDINDSTAYEMTEGKTVENLIKLSGINLDDVRIAIVNGRVVSLHEVLKEGDRIGLAATVSSLKSPLSCINKAKRVNCGSW
jgi:sulfur carrier protein ThiS